jgi:hypothetical protein
MRRKQSINRKRAWLNAATVVLDGPPFDEHVLDFSGLSELQYFQSLVYTIGRERWVAENEGSRVPKGYYDRLRLGLTAVSNGSAAVTVVGVDDNGQDDLFGVSCIKEIIDLIWRTLRILDEQECLPIDFPHRALSKLYGWGASLPAGCLVGLELKHVKSFMTDRKRESLRRIEGERLYFCDAIMLGQISAIDDANHAVSFREIKTGKLIEGHIDESMIDDALLAIMRQRKENTLSRLFAKVAYDRMNFQPEKIIGITSITSSPFEFVNFDPASPPIQEIIGNFSEKKLGKTINDDSYASMLHHVFSDT